MSTAQTLPIIAERTCSFARKRSAKLGQERFIFCVRTLFLWAGIVAIPAAESPGFSLMALSQPS